MEDIVGRAERSITNLAQKDIDLIPVVPEVVDECVVRFGWTERERSVLLQFEGDLGWSQ